MSFNLESGDDILSSLRTTSDIDIQFKAGVSQEKILEFTGKVKAIYERSGTPVKVAQGKTLVETVPVAERGTANAKFAHAVDIHSEFDSILNPTQQSTEYTWGVKIPQKPTLLEKIPTASLKEQVAGKLQGMLGIAKGGELGPVGHRTKDIVDFLADASTLVSQRWNPISKAKGLADIETVAKYFGATGYKSVTPTQEFSVSTSPKISVSTQKAMPLSISTLSSPSQINKVFGVTQNYPSPSKSVSPSIKEYISSTSRSKPSTEPSRTSSPSPFFASSKPPSSSPSKLPSPSPKQYPSPYPSYPSSSPKPSTVKYPYPHQYPYPLPSQSKIYPSKPSPYIPSTEGIGKKTESLNLANLFTRRNPASTIKGNLKFLFGASAPKKKVKSINKLATSFTAYHALKVDDIVGVGKFKVKSKLQKFHPASTKKKTNQRRRK